MTKRQRPISDVDESTSLDPEEDFFRRWSRLKSNPGTDRSALDSHLEEAQSMQGGGQAKIPEEQTDADMPSLESLNEDSDYSMFFSSKVSEELRQLALRKLFGSSKFNLKDGLDDYDEDFKGFRALGDMLTSDMRYHIERTLEEQEDKTRQAELRQEPSGEKLEADPEVGNGDIEIDDQNFSEVTTEKETQDDSAQG